VARVLADERPEVIGAVLALVPEELAHSLRRQPALPSEIPTPREQPDPALITALATALRERMVGV
jgi:hypothetical protein